MKAICYMKLGEAMREASSASVDSWKKKSQMFMLAYANAKILCSASVCSSESYSIKSWRIYSVSQ